MAQSKMMLPATGDIVSIVAPSKIPGATFPESVQATDVQLENALASAGAGLSVQTATMVT
jgi:hypothetical protein